MTPTIAVLLRINWDCVRPFSPSPLAVSMSQLKWNVTASDLNGDEVLQRQAHTLNRRPASARIAEDQKFSETLGRRPTGIAPSTTMSLYRHAPQVPLSYRRKNPRRATREDLGTRPGKIATSSSKTKSGINLRIAKSVSCSRELRTVPDLTFSEMNFLNRRKTETEGSLRSQGEKSRRRKEKAADAEVEISRFFASSKDQSRAAGFSRGHGASDKAINETVERTHERQVSSLPPVDLPEKPFLGFGSCGPGHISPVLSFSNAGSQRSPSRRLLSDRSTTYYTWSQTDLSKHSPSSNPSRSPRLSSESQQKPHSNLDLSARRREGNLREETHVSPAAQDRNKESDTVADFIPSVPPAVPERLSKSPATGDPVKTNCQKDPEVRPTSSSLAALPSSLASHNGPEVLGAVLDALLGRVTNAQSEAYHETRPARPPGGGGKEQVSAPEFIPESQTLHESNNPDAQASFLSSSKYTDSSNVAVRGHGPGVPQRSESSHGKDTRVTDQPPSRASYMQLPPEPMQEIPPKFGQLNIRATQFEGDQTVATATNGPSASNAWVSYDNIYQNQEEAPRKCRQAGEGHEHCVQFRRPSSDASNYGFLGADDQLHNLYEYRPTSCSQDLPYPVEDRPWSPNYANLPMDRETDETTGPLPPEEFNAGQAVRGAANDTADLLLGYPESIPTRHDLESHPDTVQSFSPTGFLGTRHPAPVNRPEVFSPWSSRRHQILPTSRLGILSHYSGADAVIADGAPLRGFWRPNKLY
ncbi:MAG: hypothetical protein Q9196_005372 [Gyalolechia fulgens]